MFIREVAELPVVDNFDLGLMGAARDAFDKSRAVGGNVDAGGIVDLLYHRMGLLLSTSRSSLPFPHNFRHSARLHLVLVDGVFSLRVVLEVDSLKRPFWVWIGRAFLFLFIGNVDSCSGERLFLLEELLIGLVRVGEGDGGGTGFALVQLSGALLTPLLIPGP